MESGPGEKRCSIQVAEEELRAGDGQEIPAELLADPRTSVEPLAGPHGALEKRALLRLEPWRTGTALHPFLGF
jgi:hypothetical protein